MATNILVYSAGDKYGKLTLTGKAYINYLGRRYVECMCDCGQILFKRHSSLKSGKTNSCGCIKIKHGLVNHPLYKTWSNIKNRCYQPSHRSYKGYGAKGILVCDNWLLDFQSFYNWSLANGWVNGLTIDRIKNSEGYSPDNCRWVTQASQNRNKKNNVIITAFGETKCLQDWVNDTRCTVSFNGLRDRLNYLDSETAITKRNQLCQQT